MVVVRWVDFCCSAAASIVLLLSPVSLSFPHLFFFFPVCFHFCVHSFEATETLPDSLAVKIKTEIKGFHRIHHTDFAFYFPSFLFVSECVYDDLLKALIFSPEAQKVQSFTPSEVR